MKSTRIKALKTFYEIHGGGQGLNAMIPENGGIKAHVESLENLNAQQVKEIQALKQQNITLQSELNTLKNYRSIVYYVLGQFYVSTGGQNFITKLSSTSSGNFVMNSTKSYEIEVFFQYNNADSNVNPQSSLALRCDQGFIMPSFTTTTAPQQTQIYHVKFLATGISGDLELWGKYFKGYINVWYGVSYGSSASFSTKRITTIIREIPPITDYVFVMPANNGTFFPHSYNITQADFTWYLS
ncbi:Med9 domain-containing protein [Helicobacter cetorum]|uniref:Uncharacterized protein n=1 Tax=Helicobacter cetorum (strain ATCC BAA-540 / CCUG 52418 / MIT 99-5656) TaxID=1163745 RepID=I0EQK2_HELCM|nr:hypothetical protein [Helicobacter cetorum]AFI05221.1 hypothetical protein HCD_00945 [Helicobacter cetorum MIT 99-5656]AFI06003.1 hypothetical protein HCD_05005 [Helicobacter cetorum MIT 99-5656]